MFTHTRHLDEAGFNHVVLVGEGVNHSTSEIRHLRDSGKRALLSDDGRELGLTGMVEDAMMVSG